jgi:hypothetical protein
MGLNRPKIKQKSGLGPDLLRGCFGGLGREAAGKGFLTAQQADIIDKIIRFGGKSHTER